MKQNPIIKIGLLILVAFLCLGCYWFAKWRDRVDFLQWESARQQDLTTLGERLLSFGKRNNGRLPERVEDLIHKGVITQSELSFTDPWRGVKVSRIYRPVPSLQGASELILILEEYNPPGEGCNTLKASGYVMLEKDRIAAINRDNDKRRKLGLPQLP